MARSSAVDHRIAPRRTACGVEGFSIQMREPVRPATAGRRPFASHLVPDGQGGIRTHESLSTPHAFQACAFNRSATCPVEGRSPPESRDNSTRLAIT